MELIEKNKEIAAAFGVVLEASASALTQGHPYGFKVEHPLTRRA